MTRPNSLVALAVSVLVALSASCRASARAVTAVELLQEAARKATTRRGGEMLVGLRALKDPALRPLFSALVTGQFPEQRRQGVLGLAELESPPRINPLLISRLERAVEQAEILGEALNLGYVGVEQIDEMLAWPMLDPYIELALRARLAREGRPIDRDRVAALVARGGLPTELLGATLLAQAGDPARIDEVGGKICGLADPQRGAIVGPYIETVRRERLSGSAGLLARLAAVYATAPTLHADVLRTWLRLAPSDAAPAWKHAWESSKGLSDQLRLALVALDASDHAPAEMYAPLERVTSDASLAAVGGLACDLVHRRTAVSSLAALFAVRYRPAELWVFQNRDRFSKSDLDEASRILLTAAGSRPSTLDPISLGALSATEQIILTEPELLADLLRKAAERTDEGFVQTIVLGALNAGAPPPWDPSNPPRWPDGRSAAMATLVEARHAKPGSWSAVQVAALESLSISGPERIPLNLRAQAAWFIVKLRGEADATLARLLADEQN